MVDENERHSVPCGKAKYANLSKRERVPIEAENGLRQFDHLIEILTEFLKARSQQETYYFQLRPSHLISLNRIAVDRLIQDPGNYRQEEMNIQGSGHKPPSWTEVPRLIDELCEYVNTNWYRTAVHLAAYVLWRLNWIHPFVDGNGRTARAASYLVLCARLKQILPGERTIPEFLAENKQPYYKALEKADTKWLKGTLDLSAMEKLVGQLLERQVLHQVNQSAKRESVPLSSKQGVFIDKANDPSHKAQNIKSLEQAIGPDVNRRGWLKQVLLTASVTILAASGAALVTAKCSDARCVPNSQTSCTCENQKTGFQTCNNEGTQFTPCKCGNSNTPPKTPSKVQ